MSEASHERRVRFLAFIGRWGLTLLASTWRIREVNGEILRSLHANARSSVYVFWHGQLLTVLWNIRGKGVAIMASEHGDGEIISRAGEQLGCRLVRGSSSRGAARALLAGTRAIEDGHDLTITVDGPRGPAKSVAPGALAIAHRTGAPMLPIGIWASRAWRLRSWDSFMIPKPFAKVRIAYGKPIYLDSDADRKTAEASNAVFNAIEAAIVSATEDGTK